MTGRYLLAERPEVVAAAFGIETPEWLPPRYNIAPGGPIAIIRFDHGSRSLMLVRWGLIPSWVRDPRKFGPFMNARGEGIADKPAFRGGMQYRRCLVPASGWYHWEEGRGGTRQPWLVRPRQGGPIAFAGLWDPWLGADGSEIDGALIVTVGAGADVAGIADRMPAVLEPADRERWLDTDRVSAGAAAGLLRPAAAGTLEAVPVSPRVNKVENDDPSLIAPAAGGAA